MGVVLEVLEVTKAGARGSSCNQCGLERYTRLCSLVDGQDRPHLSFVVRSGWEYAARAGTTTRYSWGDQDPICSRGAWKRSEFPLMSQNAHGDCWILGPQRLWSPRHARQCGRMDAGPLETQLHWCANERRSMGRDRIRLSKASRPSSHGSRRFLGRLSCLVAFS